MDKITYDAFISYSHSEPDCFVAQKLHFMLEHYHIPRKIQKISGKKKINRVFRDRDELPLSSDLGANIREALENSQYLIVVCSPRAVRSEWVRREIETFLETHEKNKILTLLVDGEPMEAFPEILCYDEQSVMGEDGKEKKVKIQVEPMAADIRGTTRKDMNKKLKDEFLRILAPMLSCTYDDLRQRHKEYFFRKVITITGLAAVLSILFTVYAFYQASVSESRYQEARRNQARYLAEISGELLVSGDREGALQTVLAIQPEKREDAQAIVPEQIYALNNALYSYNTGTQIDFKAEHSFELMGKTKNTDTIENGFLSPQGDAYFYVDQAGNAYILDPKEGECIWQICPGDLESAADSRCIYFYPVSQDRAVLITSDAIIYVDWIEQKVLNVISVNDDNSPAYMDNCVFAVWETLTAVTDGQTIWVYDLESGECLYRGDYAGEGSNRYVPKSLSFQNNGECVAIGVANDYFKGDETAGLFLLFLSDGNIQMLSDENTEKTVFLDNERIAAIQYTYSDGMSMVEESPEKFFRTVVYDTDTGKEIWSSEVYRTQAMTTPCTLSSEMMKVNGKFVPVLVSAIKDRIYIFQQSDGKIIQDRSFSADIEGISLYDENRILAGLSNGQIMLCMSDEMLTNYSGGSIYAETGDFIYSPQYDRVIWAVNDSHRIVFGKIFQDENMEDLSIKNTVSRTEYFTVEDSSGAKVTYRCVLYQSSGYETNGLSVYEAGSSDILFDYQSDSEKDYIHDVHIMNIDGVPYVFFYGSGILRQPAVGNLKTGELTLNSVEDQISDSSQWQYFDISYFNTASKAFLYSRDKFAVADITEKGLIMPDVPRDSNDDSIYITQIFITYDDQYAIFTAQNDTSDYVVKIWDINNENWHDIDGQQMILSDFDAAAVGRETDRAAVVGMDGSIKILDLSEGKILTSLPFGNYQKIDIAFMNHDKYLICCSDENRLTLWDIEKGEILMEEEDSSIPLSTVYTDGNDHYFAVGFYGFTADNNGFSASRLRIYYVDEAGRFYHFADVPYGYVSFEADEIFVASGSGRYAHLYTYDELRSRAGELLDGNDLTDAQKRQYFISE